MQVQVHVHPPLLALPRFPHLSRHSQSGPPTQPTPHLLDDHPGPSFTSAQQYPIPVANRSVLTPNLPPSDPAPLPHMDTHPPPCFSPLPSPRKMRPVPSFPPPHSAPHHQNHFASSATSYPPHLDRYPIPNLDDRYLRATDKSHHNQHPPPDQRRMSEPAMYGNSPSGYSTHATDLPNARHHQLQHQYAYVPPQSYTALSSPLRRASDTRSIGSSQWKDHQPPLCPYDSVELEEPLSPLNPTFSGGESPPSMSMSEMMFGSLREDYGPSPPDTGTSTSSNTPATYQQTHAAGEPSSTSNSKQYAFVSLPGNVVKKRPRRRYDEIERLYQCSWPNCTKAYGTLNHLNAHITMQKHGPKRSPNEFKELRKQWRKAKKEEAEAKALDAVRHAPHHTQHASQHHTPHAMSSASYQTHHVYPHHPARSAHPIGPTDDLHDSLTHQRDAYPRRSQRYGPFVSPHTQHSEIAYPHPHIHSVNTPSVPMDRLPANSTLLTPLPGYEPSSMGGAADYAAYDPYRSDSRSRTGHGSPISHGDRGRPRSGHVTLGTGYNRDYS